MIARKPLPKKSQDREYIDPDAALMLRVKADDVEAFNALVERYYDRVLHVIDHLMGHGQQTQDLAQDVFLRVYRARTNYRPECKFSTWLFVIVNNVVRNARRTLARRREVQVSGDEAGASVLLDRMREDTRNLSPIGAALREESKQIVRTAVELLSCRQRDAIKLYHFKGLSYAEIAVEMETSLCAAKALLHRARVALKGELEAVIAEN